MALLKADHRTSIGSGQEIADLSLINRESEAHEVKQEQAAVDVSSQYPTGWKSALVVAPL